MYNSVEAPIIELVDVVGANPLKKVKSPINFTLNKGEHIALLGDNGSGKSVISEIICSWGAIKGGFIKYNMGNNLPLHKNIAQLTFRSEYNSADFYFQQRWNSSEYDDCPTVAEDVAKFDPNPKLAQAVRISQILDRQVLQLSSGELRRLALYKALAAKPKVLLIDNLFVGLDVAMRAEINSAIEQIAIDGDVSLIILSSRERDIPKCTTHIYRVSDMTLSPKCEYVAQMSSVNHLLNKDLEKPLVIGQPIVSFEDINIKYGSRTLFKNFNWKVNSGERWLLTGGNGSGKTTLLSLISGDNPMAYSQKISLFGRKRGSGESIWDIKKRVGFLSPEMLRGYLVSINCENIVASGFFDTVGLYQTPTTEQLEKAVNTMEEFGVRDLVGKSFNKISSGEQRMVLAARAFVKNPELLILDEPFHELDMKNSQKMAEMITKFASDTTKTIIYVSHYKDDIPPLTTNTLQLKGTSSDSPKTLFGC